MVLILIAGTWSARLSNHIIKIKCKQYKWGQLNFIHAWSATCTFFIDRCPVCALITIAFRSLPFFLCAPSLFSSHPHTTSDIPHYWVFIVDMPYENVCFSDYPKLTSPKGLLIGVISTTKFVTKSVIKWV